MNGAVRRGRRGGHPWAAAAIAAMVTGLVALGALNQRTAAGSESGVQARSVPRPDVVLLVVDGLGPRDVGRLGGQLAPTPTMDDIVTNSVVYADAYASSPWASESLRSLLTGCYGSSGSDAAAPPTLAEELGYLAYRTALVPGHARHALGAADDASAPPLGFESCLRPKGLDQPAGATADAVADLAVDWLAAGERPSLLVATFADPRPPHHRYPGLVAAADAAYEGPVRAGLAHDDLLRIASQLDDVDRERLEALHASEVAATDRAIARVLAVAVERRPTRPHVVLVGLRAPALGRDGRFGLVPSLDPEDLRVPLIVRFSPPLNGEEGRPLRGVLEEAVSLVDVVPTLLDALGADVRLDVDGRSVFPGARAPVRPLLAATARGVRAAVSIEGQRAIELCCEPPRARVHARLASDEVAPPERWSRVESPTAQDADLRRGLGEWMVTAGVAPAEEAEFLPSAPFPGGASRAR